MTFKRAGDLALYVAIGIAFVVSAFWAADHDVAAKWPLVGRFVVLCANTAVIFGYSIRGNRRLWSNNRYWLLMAGLLAVHLVAFSAVLMNVEEWRLTWWIPIIPIEIGLVAFVIGLMPVGARH